MSIGGNPTGFSISDFLTRIIPGSILVFSIFFPVLWPEYSSNVSISNSGILIFTIISFIAGEVINTGRITLLDVPNYFRRVLYTESGYDKKYLKRTDVYLSELFAKRINGYSLFRHSNRDIIKTLRNRFDLDTDFDGSHNFFMLLTSDLSSAKSTETQRLENIYIFYENLKYSVVISFLWQILFAVYTFIDPSYQTGGEFAFALLIAYLLFIILYSIVMLFGWIVPIDQAYIESLLSDYLVYVNDSG